MSNYITTAKNRETGEYVDVYAMDDYFGHHCYGYKIKGDILNEDEYIEQYEEVDSEMKESMQDDNKREEFINEVKDEVIRQELNAAIEGYNREKEILSEQLAKLLDSNKTISTRYAVESRLREIDEAIQRLIIIPLLQEANFFADSEFEDNFKDNN